jgi:Fusaric acid resistance protein-like
VDAGADVTGSLPAPPGQTAEQVKLGEQIFHGEKGGTCAGCHGARILGRWSGAWRQVLASALGAALAWVLAERLLGHPQPIFAPISAIGCLSPGLPSHTKQTMGLLLGVATGIVIGELTLTLPDTIPLLKNRIGGVLRDDRCSLLWTVGSGSHSAGSLGDPGRGARIGHHRIGADGRRGHRRRGRLLH